MNSAAMIRLLNLMLQCGPRRLLEATELTLHAGQKAGLIGTNGAGKSGLLALLRGQLGQDTDDYLLPTDQRIVHMRQEVDTLDRLAMDHVLDGDGRLREIQAALAATEAAYDGSALARLHTKLDNVDGYTADTRVCKLLTGFGFNSEWMERRVSDLPGGQRMCLDLAQALIRPSDLLLPDKPTNHLDLDAILWLEERLEGYPGTLVLISHDCDFLDVVVDYMVHPKNRKLTLYHGGYSTFKRTHAEWLAQQQQAYKKQQVQHAHVESFITRFKVKATRVRRAQSRIKTPERFEELTPAHVDSPFNFSFRESDRISWPLLDLGEGRFGYSDKAVLGKVKLQLVSSTRIGLFGPSGAGRSTLIKTLVGDLPELDDRLLRDEDLAVGYPTQHQLDSLDPRASPLLYLRRITPGECEQTLKDFLDGFDFRGVRVDEPVLNSSDGGKAHSTLALVAWQKPNLLLPDELTNHLDLEICLAPTLALQELSGAVLVVSHDRHLLKNIIGEFLLVADGRMVPFDGSLDDYAHRLVDYRVCKTPQAETASGAPFECTDERVQRQTAAALRQQLAPHKREADKLEHELDGLHEKLAAVEVRLGDSALHDVSRKDELRELLSGQSSLKVREGELEGRWLEALETFEVLQKGLETDE